MYKKRVIMKKKIITLLIFLISTASLHSHEKLARKTVFLTGAAGFIGSNFLKYMFDKYPTYDFEVLDALTYAGSLDNIPDYIKNSDRFKFYYGSVNNYLLVDALMSKAHLVVHFAAESHVTRSILDDTTFFETDVLGTRIMMTALVKHRATVERYIHISTSEVLGTALHEPMDEEHPLNPRSPYAGAKAGADRLVYSYWCTYDIPAVIVRPFNNYGPQQHLEKVIPRFIASAIQGEPLTIHGDGTQSRDWLHTQDLARALDIILHKEDFAPIKNQVFHIGSGIATPINEIAAIIAEYFDLPQTQIRHIGDRPGQVHCHISSTKKAWDLLGWKAEIPLKEGLLKTIRWYEVHTNRWKNQNMLKHIPIYTNDAKLELH